MDGISIESSVLKGVLSPDPVEVVVAVLVFEVTTSSLLVVVVSSSVLEDGLALEELLLLLFLPMLRAVITVVKIYWVEGWISKLERVYSARKVGGGRLLSWNGKHVVCRSGVYAGSRECVNSDDQ